MLHKRALKENISPTATKDLFCGCCCKCFSKPPLLHESMQKYTLCAYGQPKVLIIYGGGGGGGVVKRTECFFVTHIFYFWTRFPTVTFTIGIFMSEQRRKEGETNFEQKTVRPRRRTARTQPDLNMCGLGRKLSNHGVYSRLLVDVPCCDPSPCKRYHQSSSTPVQRELYVR